MSEQLMAFVARKITSGEGHTEANLILGWLVERWPLGGNFVGGRIAVIYFAGEGDGHRQAIGQ